MARPGITAKFLLLAFAANVALCPCASLAAESPSSAPTAASAGADHSAHYSAARPTDTADHLDENCHTESPGEECGMVAGLDLDGGFDRVDVATAIPTDTHIAVQQAGPTRLIERHRPDRWRPPDTPLARFDRLLT